MADFKKKQGDDITLSITVGTAVNIDNLAELFIYIVDTSGNIAVKFSKAGTGDFLALTKVSTTNYTAAWLSGSTKDATKGIYTIEGNVAETDADYESSEENTITCDDRIMLSSSVSKASSSG